MLAQYFSYFLSYILGLMLTYLAPKNNALELTPRAYYRRECIVQPSKNGSDDAIAIKQAFNDCGHGGKVIFLNQTYHIQSVMNTTGLEDCDIELHGTILWSTDIDYWLNNSLPVGYQNQSTAWVFGGRNIHWQGFGYGTLDGNGQTWYDFVQGESNYPRRPHQITFWETYDSVFEGIRFVQSQMWTMTLIHAKNVLLQDIYVNSTSNSSAPSRNTDGADTIYASNITFARWHVINGDDAISAKANSSDIYVYDSIFEDGQGLAIGSLGQYNGVYEFVENFHAWNITLKETRYAIYIKTWTGVQKGYPPNGGGGGLGYAKNISLQNIHHTLTRGALSITQCTSFNGASGDCDTSTFQISDLRWGNLSGSTAPCTGVEISDVELKVNGTSETAEEYECDNVEDPIGFTCD